MQFHRTSRKPDTEERVLPLINVVFLLLIFFMLAGRLSEAELFKVTPPQSTGAGEAAAAAAEAVELLLAADGRLALNGELLRTEELKSALAARGSDRAGLPVTLKADAEAAAVAVVAVMESLRAAGFRNVQLVAQAPAAGGEGRP